MLGRTLSWTLVAAPLRIKRIAGISLALAALAILATASPAFGWSPGSFSTDDEQLLFTLTNQDRASAGLPALTNDSYLHKEAEWRAQDMGDRDYFSHKIPPDNKMVFDYMQADHYCFKVAGENIGLSTYGDDIATTKIEAAFMGSTSHRENILGTWSKMGIGAYKAADGRKLYAVLFSLPCGSSAPKATAKPKAAATAKPVVKATATPTPTPSATPAPTDTPDATDAPTDVVAVANPTTEPTDAAGPTSSMPSGQPASMRVREKGSDDDPFSSIVHSILGLFGW